MCDTMFVKRKDYFIILSVFEVLKINILNLKKYNVCSVYYTLNDHHICMSYLESRKLKNEVQWTIIEKKYNRALSLYCIRHIQEKMITIDNYELLIKIDQLSEMKKIE